MGRRPRAGLAAAHASRGRVARDRRGPRRIDDHGGVARLPRRRARRRVRRGVDHGRRASVRPAHRRGAGECGRDEPADPLRRGPDEPGELRDDAPRVGGRAHGRDPHVRGWVDLGTLRSGRCRRCRRARAHGGRQPDHASPVPRARPDRARRGAVRAGHRRGGAPDGPRARADRDERRCPRLRPAVHRRARRRRHGRRDPERGSARPGDRQSDRRRRHERRDRARQPRPTPRGFQPHGTCVRGGADLVRTARRARSDRARAHRPRVTGAAVQGDRRRSVERRPGVRCRRGDRGRRQRHHRGDRGAVPRRCDHGRRGDRRVGRRADPARRGRRSHVLLRAARLPGRAASRDHPERRAPDPAREGGPVRGVPAADGRVRHRDRGSHPAGGSVRRSYRPGARDGARSRAGLRPRERDERGERRRHGRPHRPAEPGGPRRDRTGRPTSREARDRSGAPIPGALRRGDGYPARHRSVPAARRCRRPSRPTGRGGRPPLAAAAALPDPRGATHERRVRSQPGRRGRCPAPTPHRRPRGSSGRSPGCRRREGTVHHAHPYPVRGAERGRPRHDRAQRRHDPRAGRHRVPRGARRAPADEGRRVRHRGGAGAVPARAGAPTRPGHRPAGVRPDRPQPEQHRARRRHRDRVRACLRVAVRARPRRRPPVRHDRGLPELREARLHHAVPAPLGRHGLRARRPAGEQTALRHGLCAHALLGQAVHGVGHAPPTRAGHGRDGPHPVRRRRARGRPSRARA